MHRCSKETPAVRSRCARTDGECRAGIRRILDARRGGSAHDKRRRLRCWLDGERGRGRLRVTLRVDAPLPVKDDTPESRVREGGSARRPNRRMAVVVVHDGDSSVTTAHQIAWAWTSSGPDTTPSRSTINRAPAPSRTRSGPT